MCIYIAFDMRSCPSSLETTLPLHVFRAGLVAYYIMLC